MSELKTLRLEKKMTQQQVADLVGISLRSYKAYENEIEKENSVKYNYIIDILKKTNVIDEDHGIPEHLELLSKSEKQNCSYILGNKRHNFSLKCSLNVLTFREQIKPLSTS